MSVAIHRVILSGMAVAAAILLTSVALADLSLARRVYQDVSSVRGVSEGQIVDENTIAIKVGGVQSRINLDNLRAELAAAPRNEHPAIYRRFVASYRHVLLQFSRGAGPGPIDPGRLYLIVRNQDYIAGAGDRLQGLTGRSISRDLVILLAVNQRTTITSVGASTLAVSGLTFEAAIQRAQANLDKRADFVRIRRVPGSHTIWGSELEQDFGSSLILSERFLRRAVATAGGPVVLGVPERGHLYFAPANNPNAVAALESAVRRFHAEAIGNKQLSSSILYSDGGPVRLR